MRKKSGKMKDNGYIINLNRCNQRCLFCLKSHDIASHKKTTAKEVIAELQIAKSSGYENAYFFGGEPTVFGFLPDMISHAQNIGMRAFLATNAVRFSSASYAKSFFGNVDEKKLEIRISLHSHLPEVHDRITQVKGSHAKTVSGISKIMKHVKPSVTVVVTVLNYQHLEDIVEYLHSIGISIVKFAFLVMTGRAADNEWLQVGPSEYIQPLVRAVTLAKKLDFAYVGVENFSRRLFEAMVANGIQVEFNEAEYDDVLEEMEVEKTKLLEFDKSKSKKNS